MRNWASERLSHLAKVTWPVSLAELASGPSLSLSPDSELLPITQEVPFSGELPGSPGTAVSLEPSMDLLKRQVTTHHIS